VENLVVFPSSNRVKRDIQSGANLNYSSYNWSAPFIGSNPFQSIAQQCVDNNFTGISNQGEFLSYISKQISEDDLVGYRYNDFVKSACLTWPNFTAGNDVEAYNTTFPNLTSRMLMIAPMYTTQFSLAGVFETYNFIGADNANVLLHDGFGDGWSADPNNCTFDALINFISEGNPLFISFKLTIGTLPANGSTCVTDHTGQNNAVYQSYQFFLQNQEPSSSSNSNMKLGLGLGLGLGFPILIALIVFGGYWFLVRRKQKKVFIPRPKYIPRDPSEPREQPMPERPSFPERPPSIIIGDWKDRSLFPE
jgi:hypothetical protein